MARRAKAMFAFKNKKEESAVFDKEQEFGDKLRQIAAKGPIFRDDGNDFFGNDDR
jgi:hypothetical protein